MNFGRQISLRVVTWEYQVEMGNNVLMDKLWKGEIELVVVRKDAVFAAFNLWVLLMENNVILYTLNNRS